MEEKAFNVSMEKNPLISVKIIPGHFTTGNAHSNNFLDVNSLKSNALIARDVARELAIPYLSSTLIDTIVCMEKTEVIGAYLAEELLRAGTAVMNQDTEVHVITPISNANGNWVFQDNMVNLVSGKNVLLLFASISSGRTLNTTIECLEYYGGKMVGISSLFVASLKKHTQEIHTLFTEDDIPGYKIFNTGECAMCKAGQKLDAIINSEGYTKIT
ncbi:MAG: phosphoribosyltransferase [Treponema sp.]|nr:phosphoribosyltransferase [Treponema sp.]